MMQPTNRRTSTRDLTENVDVGQGVRGLPNTPPTRAQQWRQAYRSSQSITLGSDLRSDAAIHELIERGLVRASHTGELQRVGRLLPEEPNTPQRFSGYLTPDYPSLHSSGLRQVGRASSFDGRTQVSVDSQFNSPAHGAYHSQITGQFLSPTQAPRSRKHSGLHDRNLSPTGGKHPQYKRDRLKVAPSIEISHVHEDSDSSVESNEQVVQERKRYPRGLRANSSACLSSREGPSFLVHSSTQPISNSNNRTVVNTTSSRLSLRPSAQHSTESMHYTDSPSSSSPYSTSGPDERPRSCRPKLTRQPKSFQMDTPTHGDGPLDDFDYFCRIANSPSGSKVAGQQAVSKTLAATSLKPQRQSPATRSHSMRTNSPPADSPSNQTRRADSQTSDHTDHRYPCSPDRQKKSTHLKPPSRSQLRRASTEEEQLKPNPFTERRPVTATLSYSSINSSLQSMCKAPPRYVPNVPICPVPCSNPGVPLGVPLSEDSLVADEPGMTYYQVQVLGSSGVGKTSLCQQLALLTSGKSPALEPDEEETPEQSHSVTAALSGSVYTVNFVDTSADSFEQKLEIKIRDCTDAFLVVYAIDDIDSYESARLIITALSPGMDPCNQSPSFSGSRSSSQVVVPTPIVLVANKADLVRGRQVPREDGRYLAGLHDAKFIEVSASLNHMIADLFVQLVQLLGEAEQKGRDPRLPSERRGRNYNNNNAINQYSSSPGAMGKSGGGVGSVNNTFRIPQSGKSSITKFFKRHFTRTSEDGD